MNDNKSVAFDYKIHILVACTADGKMSVICHWPHLPRQAEVQGAMDGLKEGHVIFLLCTPTLILPAATNGSKSSDPWRGSAD